MQLLLADDAGHRKACATAISPSFPVLSQNAGVLYFRPRERSQIRYAIRSLAESTYVKDNKASSQALLDSESH